MIVLHIVDLFVNFFHSFPVFTLNAIASLAQKVDRLTIVICEGGDSDFDLLYRLLLKAKIGQQGQPALHFRRDPVPERVRPRIVGLSGPSQLLLEEALGLLVEPLVEKVRRDVKFDRVVAGRDRFHVPLHVAELLVLADVVEVVDDEEGQEDGCACYD